MLKKNGVAASLFNATDNNDIDKAVHTFKPDIVIIEALWVVPEKFAILAKLHPRVQWVIRIHSEVPFLANEGIAAQWIYEYHKYSNVYIAANSIRLINDLGELLPRDVALLPNYYEVDPFSYNPGKTDPTVLNIGCFGAIRPFKNHLAQATAAIKFAQFINKPLRFHVNHARVEQMGEPNFKNLVNLFENNAPHQLVTHGWLVHNEFIKLLRTMDIVMQVSFTESFNIISADATANDIPIVVSPEVTWASYFAKTASCKVPDILSTLKTVWRLRIFGAQHLNKISLYIQMQRSKKVWLNWLLH
jgi:hypothetical protein